MFVRSFLLAACLLTIAGPAGAAWLETGLSVCDNEYTQQYPSIVSDGAGGMILVWEDWRGTSRDIYAQRVSADGELLWGSAGVPVCTVEGNQQYPVAVADGAGGAIVAWADNRAGGAMEDIDLYVQRIGPDGNTRWGERAVVLCGAPHTAMSIRGVSDCAGGVIFAWSDYRNNATTQIDIYAQRVDTSGVCRWAPDGLPVCVFPGYQAWPGMACDGAGGATFSWCDQRTGPYGTCMQRIAADGTMAFPANGIEIFSLAGDECGNIVPFAGDTVAAWIMHYTPTDTLLLAQLVDADGREVWPAPVTIVSGPDIYTRAAARTGEDLVVAWTAPGPGGYDVFAQRIGPDGAVRWPAGGLPVCTAAGEQRIFLHLFADGEGGALLAWQDKRNGRLDFYAQRIDADGAPLWTTDGVSVCTAECDKDFPSAISDGAGGLLTAWQAPAGVYKDVFAGRVFANGGITAVLLAGFDASLRDGAAVIRWTLSEAAPEARFVVSRSAGEAFVPLPAAGLEGSGRAYAYTDDSCRPGTAYVYRVAYEESAGERRVLFQTAPLLIPAAPLALHQNRPNPFNPSTTIVFDLPARAEARLTVYDAAGRLVRRLAAGELAPGRHELRWDGLDDAGRPAASGVYFCRLRAGKETRSIRLVLLR